jgi:chemotaxis protein MotB
MEKTALIVLALALGLTGCASTKECDQRVVDLEKELHGLKADETKLKEDETMVNELTSANRALSQKLQEEIAKGQLTINQLRDRLTISVVEEVLFPSGSAEIHADGKTILDKVADVLKGIDNRLIMVEGHTDDVPIGPKIADKFPTNWELSNVRATTVVRYLQSKGVPPQAPRGCRLLGVSPGSAQ